MYVCVSIKIYILQNQINAKMCMFVMSRWLSSHEIVIESNIE